MAQDGDVTLLVDGDVEVRYGPVHDATAKSQALRAILRYADEEGGDLLSVDLSAAAAPTARFVGSQQPLSVPDPSADVPATVDGVEDDAQRVPISVTLTRLELSSTETVGTELST